MSEHSRRLLVAFSHGSLSWLRHPIFGERRLVRVGLFGSRPSRAFRLSLTRGRGDVPVSGSGETPAAWEWYEFICPVHGVIVRHRRSDPRPPDVPITCPDDMLGLRI